MSKQIPCPNVYPASCAGYHTMRQYYNPPQNPYRWYNIRGRYPQNPPHSHKVQLIEFSPTNMSGCPCGCNQLCKCGMNCPCCRRGCGCGCQQNN